MFGPLLEGMVRLLALRRDVDLLRGELEELRSELRNLSEKAVRRHMETEAGFAREQAEREKFMLQVQNLLLQWERRLPDAKLTRRPRRKRGN